MQIDDEGNIYINGEILKEGYGKEVILNPGSAAEPITLGDDEYFVMGDNRNNSADSRDPRVGNVHRSTIVGKAWLRIWPLSRFGILKHR
ncbi:signal peptidase I [Clostridium sp. CAG:510]|nr:signal peptidase I [Clostridium sp. CAG:510]